MICYLTKIFHGIEPKNIFFREFFKIQVGVKPLLQGYQRWVLIHGVLIKKVSQLIFHQLAFVSLASAALLVLAT